MPADSQLLAAAEAERRAIIYVAGAFRAQTAWQVEQNIRRAEAWALHIWKSGKAVPICPHSMNRFFEGEAREEVWLTGDIALMLRCDAVLVVQGSDESTGTQAEIEIAERAGLPVFRAFNCPSCAPPAVNSKGTTLDAWIGGYREPA